jgi:hypothetical protein
VPEGQAIREQRLDETETGEGTTVTLIDSRRPADWVKQAAPEDVARWLGLAPKVPGLVSWDVFDAVLSPGDIIVMITWRNHAAAENFEHALTMSIDRRLRRIRVVRDYGMFDRREAPQYYPEATRTVEA